MVASNPQNGYVDGDDEMHAGENRPLFSENFNFFSKNPTFLKKYEIFEFFLKKSVFQKTF